MVDWMSKSYFLDSSGRLDTVVDSLGDCIVQSTYLIGKNKFDDPKFYIAFLNETTIFADYSIENELIDLGTIGNVFRKFFFSLERYDGINEKAPEKVSEILSSGDIPIIHPIIERVPFAELYDPEYKENIRRSDHVFIIIGEDDNNFFCVDNPSVIVKDKYNIHPDNTEVGVLPKKIFSEITKDCCDIFKPVFYENRVRLAINDSKRSFIDSFENYKRSAETSDGITTYYGRSVLKKLRELFYAESMCFTDIAPSKDRNTIKFFSWKIWNIKGRRMLQKKYLDDFGGTSAASLSSAVGDSIKCWEMLNFQMYKDFIKGEQVVGKKYISVLDRCIDAEDKMNRMYSIFI